MKKLTLAVMALLPLLLFGQYRVASKSGTPKKMFTLTKYDAGWVIMKDGTRKEGDLQIKVLNDTDTVEVRLKSDAGKEKWKRAEVQSFGLNDMTYSGQELADTSMGSANRMTPGYIIIDGQKIEGSLVLQNEPGNMIRYWMKQWVVFEAEGQEAKKYFPGDLELVMRNDEGKELIYYPYKEYFLQEMGNGGLVYTQNPYPTVVNKMASMAAGSVAADVNEDLSAAAEDPDTEVSGPGVQVGNVYYKEFMVKKPGDSDWTIINKKNFKDLAPSVFSDCSMDPKMYKKWSSIKKAIDYYVANCGQ